MSLSRIAARYAKPILELAQERKQLDKVKADMENFVSLCKESRDLSLMLESPIIPDLRKAEILRSIFSGKVTDLTLQAFDIVTRKNRGNLLRSIAEEFLFQYNGMKGLQEVSVRSSIKLTKDQLKEFEKIAKDLTGRQPIITEYVDTELIGGYVLQVGDKQIDQSISGQLKNIKLKLQTR